MNTKADMIVAQDQIHKAVSHLSVALHALVAEEVPVSHQVELWCDGGLRGPNPGSPMYGSYSFEPNRKHEIDFGRKGTSNEAEYLILAAGLRAVREVYEVSSVALIVKTDSELVRSQVLGGWRVKAEHLRPLRDEVRKLLIGFASWEIVHVPRAEVVKVLQH